MDDEKAGLVTGARVTAELSAMVLSSRARIAKLNIATNVNEYERLYTKARRVITQTQPEQKVAAYFRLFEEVFKLSGFEDLALRWSRPGRR